MSAPDKVHAEQFVDESKQRLHLGSQDEQTVPFSNQYPSGHGKWQVELRSPKLESQTRHIDEEEQV